MSDIMRSDRTDKYNLKIKNHLFKFIKITAYVAVILFFAQISLFTIYTFSTHSVSAKPISINESSICNIPAENLVLRTTGQPDSLTIGSNEQRIKDLPIWIWILAAFAYSLFLNWILFPNKCKVAREEALHCNENITSKADGEKKQS